MGRTDAATVRKTFEYVSKYPIIDVRFQRSRFSSHQRGTAYVEFTTMQHAREVLTYLRNATPKFNIDGKIVHLDYSDIETDQERKTSTSSLFSTGAVKVNRGTGQAAIGAGQWSAMTQEQLEENFGEKKYKEKVKKKKKKQEQQ